MQFNDIFKASFLERSATFSVVDTVISLALACVIGLFIYFIYKKTYSGVLFSRSFGISLVALSMISTFVILAVTSNVVLSLGMVGALSIVRFRTAVKDPLDIVYLFWAIGVGIVLGACLYPLAVIGSLIVGGILYLFSVKQKNGEAYILILAFSAPETEQNAISIVQSYTDKMAVKSKTITRDYTEITYAISLKSSDTSFIRTLADLPGVEKALLVNYNGDYME